MKIIDILIIKAIRFFVCWFTKRNPELYEYIIPTKKMLIDISLTNNGNPNTKKGYFVKYYSIGKTEANKIRL